MTGARGRPRPAARGRAAASIAAVATASVLVLSGCAGADEGDVTACSAMEETQARVAPILEAGRGVTSADAGLSAHEHATLSQWTFDLADASSAATDDDLRETIRRAADLAHDVYAGGADRLPQYDDFVDRARDLCERLGASS